MSGTGERRTPSATPRAQPFYCPYCGEGELCPAEASDGWWCQLCRRVFVLRFMEIRR